MCLDSPYAIITLKMKRSNMLGVGKGYTIVEALIFLAVSGALLISAMALISGKQERTRFANSVDDIGQRLGDIFNDVSTGFYPSADNLKCLDNNPSATASDISITIDPAIAKGTNSACVFSGKLINFPSVAPQDNYTIYTMVTSSESTAFIGGHTKLAGVPGGNAGISDKQTNQADVNITKVVEKLKKGAIFPTYTSLLVVSDFGSSNGSTLSGNAGKVKLYGYKSLINSSALSTALADLVPIASDSQIVLCLVQGSGSNPRVGSVSITPQLTIDRTIGTKDTSAGC